MGRLFDTLLAAAPIGGPTVVVFANAACVYKLKKKGIDVLEPAKLKPASSVSIVCFDKTGTLTGNVVSPSLLCICRPCLSGLDKIGLRVKPQQFQISCA